MKNKNILLIIFIFIVVFSIIIIKPIENLDELWNYNTARAISEGLVPYKDISMITTPLLPMITAIFLKFVANEVIISRILIAFIWTGILFTIYKILKNVIKEDNTCLIFTFLIGILCRDIYCIDYNITVLLLALIILYNELKNINNVQKYNKKYDIILGILAGLSICTKQSIGITLSIIFVGYKLLFVENKDQLKQYIKTAITRIVGICIPLFVLFIYLIVTNSICDFIDYAILGISTFSNKISYLELLNSNKITIKMLSIIIPLTIIINALYIIFLIVKKKKNNNLNNILTLFLYSLSIIIVMYPISDEIHFLIGSLITIILLIYDIYVILIKLYIKININKKKFIYKTITIIISILLFALISTISINNLYKYIKIEKNKTIEHFKYINISEHLQKRINEINKYILEQESNGNIVYILDAEAVVYMIPINKYNKNYDMFLKGNLGVNGEEKIIEHIKNKKENEIFLIKNQKLALNWQTPKNILQEVRKELELVGGINIYEIYK